SLYDNAKGTGHDAQPTVDSLYEAIHRANGSTLNDGEAVRAAITSALAAQPPAAPGVPPEVLERRRKGLSDYERPPLGQPPSWRTRQSVQSRSDSAGSVLPAAGCHVRHMPNVAMSGRPRRAAGLPQIASARGVQGLRGIRRGSSHNLTVTIAPAKLDIANLNC